MKKYIILFFIVIQISCNKKEVKVENETVIQKITIDTFSNFPPEIDGAGCYISNNRNEFEKREYIFVNDLQKISFMKINGKIEKFNLVSWDTLPDKKSIYKYKNQKYYLEVLTKDSLQIDYNTILNGKLKLKSKDNQIIEKKFTGECGC